MRQNVAGSRLRKQVSRLVLSCGLVAAVSMGAVADTVNVTIQGGAYDSTGAGIPQATVTAVNTATGLNGSATAIATGEYQIALLPPGNYSSPNPLYGTPSSVFNPRQLQLVARVTW
jgi:hypothetical protein